MKLTLLLAALFIALSFVNTSDSPDIIVAESGGKKNPVVYCGPSFDATASNDNNGPLLNGLGGFNYSITTSSTIAQKYFSQGLALTYGFNHGEAARSFRTALRFDSTCAMAWWGLAMVLGPNYNAALNPTSLSDINDAISNAVKYSGTVTANEKALINAMTKRFPKEEVSDMVPYYEAYAREMGDAHQKFPEDTDIATILADALMNLHPWNLWLKDGTAQPWTPEIIALLEKTLVKAPDHPGAMHYYIHAIEASKHAEKALVYADKLVESMPAAGHLVHMPSHIYIRTGDYHKGVVVNEKSSEADSTYIAQCKVQGAYPMIYYPHNIHFLAACAFMEGNSKKAVNAAWMVSRKADKKYLAENVSIQHFYIIPYYVMVHLGKWNDILKLERPGEGLKYPIGIWHYARGMALAAKGNLEGAARELDTLQIIASDEKLTKMLIWDFNSAHDLVNIARYTLEGELFARKKKFAEAAIILARAIEIEDRLNYMEPPDWFFSVRHTLGHWQVKAKDFAAAEKTYREDLELFRENGWALIGLYNSLKGQGKQAEAAEVKKRFAKAWKWSDMKISSSRVE